MFLTTLQAALAAAGMAALGAAASAVAPAINKVLKRIQPEAAAVKEILAMMDIIVGDRLNLVIEDVKLGSLEIGDVDLLSAAKKAACIVAETNGLSGEQIERAISGAVASFDGSVLEAKVSQWKAFYKGKVA